MRILFVTQDDPLYTKLFFETFCKEYDRLDEIVGVVICRPMGKTLGKLMQQMYGFYGAIDFCRVGTRYAITKALGLLSRLVHLGTCIELEHLCRYYGLDVVRCTNINDPETVLALREKRIDLLVSVAAPQKFKAEILGVPALGCINIHNAKLPKYRGMLPNFWNMYRNEKSSAITIHTMDSEIDTGRIILQREFEIDLKESLDRLIRRTKALGAHYLIEVLKDYRRGAVVYRVQDNAEASYFSFPTTSDVKNFRRMGKRLL